MVSSNYLHDLIARLSKLNTEEMVELLLTPGVLGTALFDLIEEHLNVLKPIGKDADLDHETEAVSK